MRELEAQVNKGDDDPVGERQAVVRARSGRAQPLMTPALTQPGLLGGRPRAREIRDELAGPSRLQPGEDTLAQGRAGPS